MNYTLITGASSGIGYQLAHEFARHQHHVILVARRAHELVKLEQDLLTQYKIKTLVIPFDLRHPDAATKIFDTIQKEGIHVNYLVNNAGFYVQGAFRKTTWDSEQQLIELHCITYTRLIKLFLPAMLEQNAGGILNVGSTGSFVPGPYNAVYCATKSFVLSLSEALAQEVAGTNVHISALCPGRTNTDFQEFDRTNKSIFFPVMEPTYVAQIGYKALMKGQRVVIPGWSYKIQVFLTRFIPRGVVTRWTGSISKTYPLLI